jgi:hypothetical protein
LNITSDGLIVSDKDDIVFIDTKEKKAKKLGMKDDKDSYITTNGDRMYYVEDGKIVKYNLQE